MNQQTYTWEALNRLLRGLSSERVVERLLRQQQALPASAWVEGATQRARWLNRIRGRYDRLRRKRERKELTKQ